MTVLTQRQKQQGAMNRSWINLWYALITLLVGHELLRYWRKYRQETVRDWQEFHRIVP